VAMDDTIVALSSPAAPAARIVIRISGPGTEALLKGLGVGDRQDLSAWRSNISLESKAGEISRRGAEAQRVEEEEREGMKFPAWIYRFVSPRSYTGEDLAELHIPGNPLLARKLINHLIRHGARDAEPGEFTARAFFNGKIDLAQAEGIAAAIEAGNERQLAAARRLMAGELAQRLRPAMDLLAETLALVEVGIDFSEEDVRILSAQQIESRCKAIFDGLQNLKNDSQRFSRLSHEPTFVLAGRPNAGKSTLLNALAGHTRAIVSPVAGTTRDALSAEIRLKRGIVRVIDAAGLESPSFIPSPCTQGEGEGGGAARESGKLTGEQESSPHPNPPPEYQGRGKEGTIASQMQRQSLRAIEEADHLILLYDATEARPLLELSRPPSLVVRSKMDLVQSLSEGFGISAQTGEGLADLRERMDKLAFGEDSAGDYLALTARHLQCIDDALAGIKRAEKCTENEELLAAELRYSLDCLGQILGTITPDDILGKIFSSFCIGK
jgi:tRNA modification GTPase